MSRSRLKTVRLTSEEDRRVSTYLAQNPLFDGFGSLARVATLEFIQYRRTLPLEPEAPPGPNRPSWLWDHDLTETQVRELLRRGGKDRDWLIGRILDRARIEEVWRFLTLADVREALPRLRLPPKRRAHWTYALERWSRA